MTGLTGSAVRRPRPARSFIVIATLLAIASSALLGACSGGPSGSGTAGGSTPTGTADGLQVVATTTVLADIVRNVGGDRVSVQSIIPAGVGPEDYEPKPDDAKRLVDAGLIVSNGVGLDDFLDKLLGANASSTPRLVLGDGIPHDRRSTGEANPHFWLDPTIVRDHYVPAIAAKLERARSRREGDLRRERRRLRRRP